jgi:hypothetical protein
MTEGDTERGASDHIPCPFVYADGRRCNGYVARVEAYKADVTWDLAAGRIDVARPRSHYHLFCTEKGNHAGTRRQDALKYYPDQLPEPLLRAMDALESRGR